MHYQLCARKTAVKARCALIDRRPAERMEAESRSWCASNLRQVIKVRCPVTTSLTVGLVSAVAVSILFGQSLVSPGCWQSQPSSALPSSGWLYIGSLSRRSLENGFLGTTKDCELPGHFSAGVFGTCARV